MPEGLTTLSLLDEYRLGFEVIDANTPELREEVFRLRYQIYVNERQFEDPRIHPNGLETDAYDGQSRYCLLIHRRSGMLVGTVRLILPRANQPELSFPIQAVCNDARLNKPNEFPVQQIGEASRICVTKQFRRRQTDGFYPDEHTSSVEAERAIHDLRRGAPYMILGLIEGAFRMCADNQLPYMCAVMEPTLLRLLGRFGIYFDKIGPLVEFHGKRQPCIRHMIDLFDDIKAERPDVWEIVTNEGAHDRALRNIERNAA